MVVILGIASVSLLTVTKAVTGSYRVSVERLNIGAIGSQAMANFVDAMRLAKTSSLSPVPASPFFAQTVSFERSERTLNGGTVWHDPETILYDPVLGEVRWIENAGTANANITFRCNGVAPLLQGETANGLDDNGNGLIDEPGFCLTIAGGVLTASLTLQRNAPEGGVTMRTWTRSIQCRN